MKPNVLLDILYHLSSVVSKKKKLWIKKSEYEVVVSDSRFIPFQPVSNTCKSLIYGLMVIVLALFHEDTLGDLQVI